MNKEIYQKWVGLNEVRQNPGIEILGKDRGAHVTAIVWCKGKEDYPTVLGHALTERGLKLIESEDIELSDERIKNMKMDPKFLTANQEVSPKNPVSFLNFHTFPLNE
jgi:hypothetical protein